MCGRTATTRAPGEIAGACAYNPNNQGVQKPRWVNKGSSTYKPSYNNGPTSCAPILLRDSNINKQNKDSTERILLPMRWGLVPSWHKGNPKDFNFNMINCRSDTVTEKKSFLKALEKGQRCVVLADGFYEWHTKPGGEKQAYYIQLKDSVTPHVVEEDDEGAAVASSSSKSQMLTMAGLYDRQVSEEQGELYTYTIITVDASSSFSWLHHRMPAILETPDAVEKWLDTGNVSYHSALDLIVPTNSLTWYPVSSVVNNVRNDTSECIKKIDLVKEAAKKNKSSNAMAMWLKKAEKRKDCENENVASKKSKI